VSEESDEAGLQAQYLDPGIPKYESGESNHSTVVVESVDGRIILKKIIHQIGWEGVNRIRTM
jgi:hypothetical protein